jgi:hypothetical protein
VHAVDPVIEHSAIEPPSRAEKVGHVLGWVGFSLSTVALVLAPLMPNFSLVAGMPTLGLSIAGAVLGREKIIAIVGIAFAPLAIIIAFLVAIASV